MCSSTVFPLLGLVLLHRRPDFNWTRVPTRDKGRGRTSIGAGLRQRPLADRGQDKTPTTVTQSTPGRQETDRGRCRDGTEPMPARPHLVPQIMSPPPSPLNSFTAYQGGLNKGTSCEPFDPFFVCITLLCVPQIGYCTGPTLGGPGLRANIPDWRYFR